MSDGRLRMPFEDGAIWGRFFFGSAILEPSPNGTPMALRRPEGDRLRPALLQKTACMGHGKSLQYNYKFANETVTP